MAAAAAEDRAAVAVIRGQDVALGQALQRRLERPAGGSEVAGASSTKAGLGLGEHAVVAADVGALGHAAGLLAGR